MTDEEFIRWTWTKEGSEITTFPAFINTKPIVRKPGRPVIYDQIIFAEHRVRRRVKIIGTLKSSGAFVIVRN